MLSTLLGLEWSVKKKQRRDVEKLHQNIVLLELHTIERKNELHLQTKYHNCDLSKIFTFLFLKVIDMVLKSSFLTINTDVVN